MEWHRLILATRARLRAIVRSRLADHDLDDELSFHVAMEAKENVARGITRTEAERQARLALGGVEQVKERSRDVRPLHVPSVILHSLGQAALSLWRAPAFSALAVLTLALGIAAAVAVFAVTKTVLLTPLPFPEPERLVMVWERPPSGEPRNLATSFNFVRWRTRTQTLQSLGVILPLSANVSGFGLAEQVDALAVSSGFFDALAVRPLLGRTFTAADDATRPPRVVVLSYAFWMQRYEGATDVIGRLLTINGSAREIVGVMPVQFGFPAARATELYTSFPLDPSAPPGGRNLMTVGRLRRGISIEAARSDMARMMEQLGQEAPAVDSGWGASVFPLFDETVRSIRRTLWVVFGSVACLLLLACANVANLLLIRASRRAPEFALRAALGANDWRLRQQTAAENLLLTLAGAVLGLAAGGMVVVPLIPSLFPQQFPLPRAAEIALDWDVMAMTLLVGLGIAVVFSLMPIARVTHYRIGDALKTVARSSAATQSWLRRGLVIVEGAVALVLVFAATLMGRSLVELYSVDPGFERARVLTARMTLIPRKYARREQIPPFVARVLDEVQSLSGVVSASSIHVLPLSGIASSAPVFRSDRPAPPRESWPSGPVSVVSPRYFETMRIPLRGRDFTDRDRIDTPGAAIISDALARRYFPGEDALGKQLKVLYGLKSEFEIIGVAGDVRTGTLDKAPEPAVYLSVAQEPTLDIALVVRTQGPPEASTAAVRAAIARVDPEQGVSKARPLEMVISDATARPRVQAGVFGTFGFLAVVIAAVGLYGVMAYGVEQRRREMGIQLALGATPRTLLRGVVREGVGLAAIGASIGTVVARIGSRSLEGLLYQTSPGDPAIMLTVGIVLVLVACIASLAPALRATRVDPLVVLRSE